MMISDSGTLLRYIICVFRVLLEMTSRNGIFLLLPLPYTTECVRDLDWTLVIEARWLFLCHFLLISKRVVFIKAAVAVRKIGLSLKPNHHNQVKLVHLPDTECKLLWNLMQCCTVTTKYVLQSRMIYDVIYR